MYVYVYVYVIIELLNLTPLFFGSQVAPPALNSVISYPFIFPCFILNFEYPTLGIVVIRSPIRREILWCIYLLRILELLITNVDLSWV